MAERVRTEPAVGVRDGQGMMRIVIALDPETFAEVRAIALKRQCSFAAVARECIEFGLIDIADAEAAE